MTNKIDPVVSWRLEGARQDGQSVTPDWYGVAPLPIEGVSLKDIRSVVKGNGLVTEVFRTDWFDGIAHVDQIFEVLLLARGISAWHAHAHTTDRLFVTAGFVRLVLYDSRPEAASCGQIAELLLSSRRPQLVVVPPRVWHGVQNLGDDRATILNAPDHAYQYSAPDHWRLPSDTAQIPYAFGPSRVAP